MMDGALATLRAWLELVDLEKRLEAEFHRRTRDSDHVMTNLLLVAIDRCRAERRTLLDRARAALVTRVEVRSLDRDHR